MQKLRCIKLDPFRLLIFLSCLLLVISLESGASSEIIKLIEEDLNLSSKQTGLIGSCSVMGSIIASPPTAHFSQHFHPYNMFIVGLLLLSISLVGIGLLESYWSILLLSALKSAGGSILGVIIIPLITDISPSTRSATWMFLVFLSGIIGDSLGYLYASFIYNSLGSWHWVYIIEAIMCSPFIIVLLFTERNVITRSRDEGEVVSIKKQLSTLVQNPVFIMLSLSSTALLFVKAGIGFWLVPVLNDEFGISLERISVILAVTTVVIGIAGSLSGSMVFDRILKKPARDFQSEDISQSQFDFIRSRTGVKMFFYLHLLGFMFSCLAVSIENVYVFLIGLNISSFLGAAGFTVFFVTLNSSVDPKLKVQAIAFSSIITDSLGTLPGPFVIGAFIDWLGYRWAILIGIAWYVFVVFFLIYCVLLCRNYYLEVRR